MLWNAYQASAGPCHLPLRIEVLLVLLRCVALAASSVSLELDEVAHADALVAAAVLAQLYRLGLEAREAYMLGVREYASSIWNAVELLACACLLASAAAHFGQATDVVRTAGSVGALLLWAGVFHHFSAFSATGPLIRMIQQIMTDIGPFLLVLFTGIAGFGFFFLTHSPAEFGYDNEVVGAAFPFFSVFLLALGQYKPEDYEADVLSMMVLFLSLIHI